MPSWTVDSTSQHSRAPARQSIPCRFDRDRPPHRRNLLGRRRRSALRAGAWRFGAVRRGARLFGLRLGADLRAADERAVRAENWRRKLPADRFRHRHRVLARRLAASCVARDRAARRLGDHRGTVRHADPAICRPRAPALGNGGARSGDRRRTLDRLALSRHADADRHGPRRPRRRRARRGGADIRTAGRAVLALLDGGRGGGARELRGVLRHHGGGAGRHVSVVRPAYHRRDRARGVPGARPYLRDVRWIEILSYGIGADLSPRRLRHHHVRRAGQHAAVGWVVTLTVLSLPEGEGSSKSRAHLLDQRVRHLEIRIHVLHVVLIVQRIDQLQDLLALLVVDRHGVLRLPGERGLARLAELRFQSLRDIAQQLAGGVDLVTVLARHHVLGARLDRGLEHSIGIRHLGVELDYADVIEHERHRAGFGEVATRLGEARAHFAGRAVLVVGQHFDDHRDAARPVALVADLVVALGIAAGRLLDGAVDIVLRHALRPRRENRGAQARVHCRIG